MNAIGSIKSPINENVSIPPQE